MREKAVIFGNPKSLVGIVTQPDFTVGSSGLPAIIILNAGLLHRVGPNRLHVKMARKLATVGFNVIRFDFSGNGDSNARNDNIPFGQSSIDEIQDAMNYLSSSKNISKFILVGICSGADSAIKTASCDDRVVGAIGINGSYLDDNISKRLSADIVSSTQSRYYHSHLFNYKSWWRLVTGKSDLYGAIRFLATQMRKSLTRNTRSLPKTHISTITQLLAKINADLLIVYSEGSSTFDAFQMVYKEADILTLSSKLSIEIIKNSDHVFTLLESQTTLMDLVYQWATDKQRSWLTG
jgi:pimeloyl-ACP methyl ester carboxylesterase